MIWFCIKASIFRNEGGAAIIAADVTQNIIKLSVGEIRMTTGSKLPESLSPAQEAVVLKFDFDDSLGYWICSTSHAFRRALNAELVKEGITYRQWEVLARIALQGELSQTELAECLGIEAPTLVGILDRMERDGWLDRYSCPNDRRKKRIRATDKAEAVWARMVNCAHRVRLLARQGLAQEDIDQLRFICERIRTNLEGRVPAATVPVAVDDNR
jgi:MarR family transcriptional regulator for hemolysin